MKICIMVVSLIIFTGASASKPPKPIACPPVKILNSKSIRTLIEFQQDLEKAALGYKSSNGRMSNPPPNIVQRLP